MKKFGKFQKRPAAKQMLIQTYITSLICLMLCVTMFFGTTAAWFTSEVESVDNEIYVGILKVDLQKRIPADDQGTEWTSLKTAVGGNILVFDKEIKWEPNAMTIETLKVVDLGDLAFQYRLNLIPSARMTEDQNSQEYLSEEAINAIASQFDVYMRNETPKEGTEFKAPENVAEVTGQQNEWVKVGTLAEALAGKVVFDGSMDKDAVNAEEPAEHIYAIALHMKSDSTGMYVDSKGETQTIMGKKLYLNVKLVATQMPSEMDEFGKDYDQQIEVTNQDELTAAFESEGNQVSIVLSEGAYTMPSANGEKVINISGSEDAVIDLTNGAYMDSCTVTFEGVTIMGSTGKVNGNGSDYAALYTPNVTYVNCTFNGPFRIGRDGARFINCTFTHLGNDYVWTYGNDVSFEGCTFHTDGKAILIYSDGGNEVSKVTVKNCVFTSTQGAKAGAIANQNCAAIEIDNYGNGVDLTISHNTYDSNFSGEWRIKTYKVGNPKVFVNGTEYTTIALDGKTMTIDGNKNVTVQQ